MEFMAPRLRKAKPLPADVVERNRRTIERLRREHAERKKLLEPARRSALQAGPELRDLEAAVDCACSCHPRPADPDLHDAGTSCGCQLSAAERSARFDEFLASLPKPDDEARLRADREFSDAAGALGVSAKVACSAAPFVITGVGDGRGFYLRERHGSWRVTIAADPALVDPWGADISEPTIDIAQGDVESFNDDSGRFNRLVALRVAVRAVRTTLERSRCDHEPTRDHEHRYCSRCGVELARSDAWRLSPHGSF